MNNRNKIAAMVVAASIGFCFSAGAHATTTDWGSLSTGSTKSFFNTDLTGTFTDSYTFSLGKDAMVGQASTPMLLKFGSWTISEIAGYSVALFQSGGAKPIAAGTSFSTQLGKGIYQLNVSGTGTNGIYSGALTVAAVPEPETWAMILIGATLVGFQLRRKSKETSSHLLGMA